MSRHVKIMSQRVYVVVDDDTGEELLRTTDSDEALDLAFPGGHPPLGGDSS